jgi:hypothetical protein
MITIFCDFSQFSAKTLAFFSKTNVMIIIFAQFSFVFSLKRQFYCENFKKSQNRSLRSIHQGNDLLDSLKRLPGLGVEPGIL